MNLTAPTWRSALEARAIDIAVIPSNAIPARFHSRTLYDEDFVVAMRAGHPFASAPTLERFCEMQHVVVSLTGDPFGFVDRVLAEQGRSRRIALTIPNLMFALTVLAETDLIAALPTRFVALHAPRFGIVALEPPLPLGRFRLNAVIPAVAMMDTGLAWLFDRLGRAEPTPPEHRKGSSP